jgi:glucose-6-phosphate dehydrogenase assembly protein OpcA
LEAPVIVDMPKTSVSKIGRKLQDLRDSGGVVALGRVLTLLIDTDAQNFEDAVKAANAASRLHPSRIILLSRGSDQAGSVLDAEIRVGGDAGASEVVVLRPQGQACSNPESLVTGLLLPDAPVVTWWPDAAPTKPSESAFGQISSRRLTDSAANENPVTFLKSLAKNYVPGDGDMSWTRISLWRAQLAALINEHLDKKVADIQVFGSDNSPSAWLLSNWLEMRLGAKSNLISTIDGHQLEGIAGVLITFETGSLSIMREGSIAKISQSGAPDSQVLLPKRSDQDCLIEDMRFLGEDEIYGEVLQFFGKS